MLKEVRYLVIWVITKSRSPESRGVCVRCAGLGTTSSSQTSTARTHHKSKICRQTPTTHIISTIEPLYVISVKYNSSLPDDGSYVIRNMLEYFNVCLLDFCIMWSLTSTIVIIECISWLMKVTDDNGARWKPEIA